MRKSLVWTAAGLIIELLRLERTIYERTEVVRKRARTVGVKLSTVRRQFHRGS